MSVSVLTHMSLHICGSMYLCGASHVKVFCVFMVVVVGWVCVCESVCVCVCVCVHMHQTVPVTTELADTQPLSLQTPPSPSLLREPQMGEAGHTKQSG